MISSRWARSGTASPSCTLCEPEHWTLAKISEFVGRRPVRGMRAAKGAIASRGYGMRPHRKTT